MKHGSFFENRNTCTSGPDIDNYYPEFLLSPGEDCFRTRDRRRDQRINIHSRLINTFFKIFYMLDLPGDDVRFHFHTYAGHSDRILYPPLLIDRIRFGFDMKNPAIGWDTHGLCRL